MKIARLGDVFKITSGGTPNRSNTEYYDGGTIPWVKTGDLKVKDLYDVSECITEQGLQNSSAKIFPKNTILIAMYGATIGACSILKTEAATNQACAALLPNDKVDTNYLYYYLMAIKPNLIAKGIGGGQPNISATILKEVKFPLPDLQTQKQIASILEDADRARQQRRAANALTEQFLQSSFLYLFGDPVINKKGWNKQSVKSLATKYSDGPFGSNLKSEHYSDNGVLVIRLENIGVNQFKGTSRTYIPLEHYKKLEKHSCFPGDVIIGTMGEPNLRACIFPNDFEVAINKADCVLFRPNKNLVLSEYVSYLLNAPSFVKSVSNLVLGQTRGRISMGRLSTVDIPVPPLSLQQHFASIVAEAETLRQKQQQNERELEHLFQALLQQYFGKIKLYSSKEEPLIMAAEQEASYSTLQ